MLDRVHVEEACGKGVQSKKLSITIQSARVGGKLITSKLPLTKVIDVQATGKFSDLVATGLT